MLTRRDCLVALLAVVGTMATVAWAQTEAEPPLRSASYSWDEMVVEDTPTGEKRNVIRASTATLDQLTCHITTVEAGKASHAPHSHPEEELIIVKEGTLESLQNDKVTRVGPGSILFEASGEHHGLRNVGTTPATYYVIKWWPPGMLEKAEP